MVRPDGFSATLQGTPMPCYPFAEPSIHDSAGLWLPGASDRASTRSNGEHPQAPDGPIAGRRRVCLLAMLLVLLAASGLAASPRTAAGPPSAWSILEQRHPTHAAAIPPEERRVLALLTWEQLMAWIDGLDPSRIELADGRSLASALGIGFDLSWWTIDGGGGAISGGGYTLDGTLGQPDASAMKGGGFALGGGFWPSDRPFVMRIFRDGFEADAGPGITHGPVGERSP
jgi:hypothetical protein